ncbi:MAG: glutathione peroxidase [Luminiphilus sp.]|jgi:glutathione peroxidase|nr:glutathione peroxidase [Luminiphilus sp.]
MTTVFDFSAEDTKGDNVALENFRGKVLLIVNTASKCGFTPQYEGLEKLQTDYHEKGFEVLAFPCNQFGKQEPGSNEEIVEFCTTRFSATFPIFSKIDVNGADTHPLYAWLKQQAKGIMGTERIKWNFTKFLINRQGEVVKRYGSQAKPEQIADDIAALL